MDTPEKGFDSYDTQTTQINAQELASSVTPNPTTQPQDGVYAKYITLGETLDIRG